MTKTHWFAQMAEKLELTNKQVGGLLRPAGRDGRQGDQEERRVHHPRIGKLVKAERKARLGRNPQTGETIKIKAKTVVKFRVAKAAKDTIAPPKK